MIALGYPGTPDQLSRSLRERELAPRIRKPLDEFVFEGRLATACARRYYLVRKYIGAQLSLRPSVKRTQFIDILLKLDHQFHRSEVLRQEHGAYFAIGIGQSQGHALHYNTNRVG